MSSRSLNDLHPDIRDKCAQFCEQAIPAAKQWNVEKILIVCTFRGRAEQDAAYKAGLSNARWGQSKHNFMLGCKPAAKAFDFVPIIAGKAQWNTTGKWRDLWMTLGITGEKLGLHWAGRWTGKIREMDHMEID